jgi:serine/threonine protein kinase/Tfp pilus assembly protein PilF
VTQLESRTLDDYVEVFERARQAQENLDLKAFLPAPDDALYRPVLRELVRIDLEFGWESNRPRALDDYRKDFPELFADPDSLQEVAFEEYRMRRRAGESPSPLDYARRYGIRTDGWPGQPAPGEDPLLASVQVEQVARSYRAFTLSETQEPSIDLAGWKPPADGGAAEVARLFRALHAADARLAGQLAEGLGCLPEPGGDFAGFRLIAELGRGAFGRVFLARQAALYGRPVALKVAPDVGSESQALAQLQHTHIVPIYSVHRAGPLQAVCMPYAGCVTAADLVRDVQSHERPPRAGRDLLRALPGKARPAGVPLPEGPSPAVEAALARLSYPEAVLWLGGRLAEGLAHAHARGILHRDVKPGNILVTDEGLPMLLDFNLAEDLKQRGAEAALVGGTLPYMAPEHLAAFRGEAGGVDARSDIYSLGIVLFELLTGRFPFAPHRLPADGSGVEQVLDRMLAERRVGPPCPRRSNPAVSPAAAAVVRHCLEPDPARRYATAAALLEDVERHLRHEPLRHVREPSLRERAGKWLRRHPRAGYRLSVACLALAVLVGGGLGWQALSLARAREADQARQGAYQTRQDFAATAVHAYLPLSTWPDRPELLGQSEAACRAALNLYGVLDDDRWRDRPALAALPAERRLAVLGEIGELLHVLSCTVALKGGPAPEARLREGLRYSRLARECFPAGEEPPAVWAHEAWLCERLGETEQAGRAREEAKRRPVAARDLFLEGVRLTRAGRYRQAVGALRAALREEPGHYWARFTLGYCYRRLGRDALAVTCWTGCLTRKPDYYAAYQFRGMAYERLQLSDEARDDLDRAVKLAPDRPDVYFDRSLVRRVQQDFKGALADLDTALARGIPMTRVYFVRSRVRDVAGDKAGAKADLAEGLRRQPADEKDWIARGVNRMNREPEAALRDFDEALKLNPRSLQARHNQAHVLAEIAGRGESELDRLARQCAARGVLEALLDDYPDDGPSLAGLAVVLARLGARDLAHSRIADALTRDTAGLTRYQAACVYAHTSRLAPADAERALAYLRMALKEGVGLEYLPIDADLDPIRHLPAFQRLAEGAKLLR